MPFASKSQRGFLFARHPGVAKEFASKMTHGEEEALPEHVKKMDHGGYACMHCGGATDMKGYSEGGEVVDSDNDETPDTGTNIDGETTQRHLADESDEHARRRGFVRAVRGMR